MFGKVRNGDASISEVTDVSDSEPIFETTNDLSQEDAGARADINESNILEKAGLPPTTELTESELLMLQFAIEDKAISEQICEQETDQDLTQGTPGMSKIVFASLLRGAVNLSYEAPIGLLVSIGTYMSLSSLPGMAELSATERVLGSIALISVGTFGFAFRRGYLFAESERGSNSDFQEREPKSMEFGLVPRSINLEDSGRIAKDIYYKFLKSWCINTSFFQSSQWGQEIEEKEKITAADLVDFTSAFFQDLSKITLAVGAYMGMAKLVFDNFKAMAADSAGLPGLVALGAMSFIVGKIYSLELELLGASEGIRFSIRKSTETKYLDDLSDNNPYAYQAEV